MAASHDAICYFPEALRVVVMVGSVRKAVGVGWWGWGMGDGEWGADSATVSGKSWQMFEIILEKFLQLPPPE